VWEMFKLPSVNVCTKRGLRTYRDSVLLLAVSELITRLIRKVSSCNVGMESAIPKFLLFSSVPPVKYMQRIRYHSCSNLYELCVANTVTFNKLSEQSHIDERPVI
jgi:hypothetical protein